MKIVHVFRTPVGGLFRHVCDLAAAQAERGHEVGVIHDNSTGDALSDTRLEGLTKRCVLGVYGLPMSRTLSHRDIISLVATRRIVNRIGADVLHGHGAKGGALVRLATLGLAAPTRVFYTPHGGSLHFDPATIEGRLFLGLEAVLDSRTDGLIFESAFSAKAYEAKVKSPGAATRIVPNGLRPEEFEPVAFDADAADFVFVGELRELKGVDVLLHALGRTEGATACIVGAGPDADRFAAVADELGLRGRVRFAGPMPARRAFARGRTLVVPSRAESFPYIVLEAAAAGMPLIATGVGGIPEILEGSGVDMLPPGDVAALSGALAEAIRARHTSAAATLLRSSVAERFTVARMADAVLGFYAHAPAAAAALQPYHSEAH